MCRLSESREEDDERVKTTCPMPALSQILSSFFVVLSLSSVQSLSRVQLFVTPWTAARQASLSITNSWSLLTCVDWVGGAIQPSHPLWSPSPTFSLSVTWLRPTLCDPMDYSMPGFPILHQLPKLVQIESVMASNDLVLCHPLLLLPSIFPSITVFSNESALCIRWPKYWSFSFNISPSNEQSGLISFTMDWFDLLAVQGTLKSLLQHHSSKASVLWSSAFFIVQL